MMVQLSSSPSITKKNSLWEQQSAESIGVGGIQRSGSQGLYGNAWIIPVALSDLHSVSEV